MGKKLFILLACLFTFSAAIAQTTTSGMRGKITQANDVVIGASIMARHVPSGTVYRAVTNRDGRFSIQGMRVGGPYEVEINYIGAEKKQFKNIMLRLGETEDLSCNLQEDPQLLQEVVVTGRMGLDANKTGAAFQFAGYQRHALHHP